jgi:hypothetical protein
MPSNKENKYQADPVVQFCSGPPSYHRLVITFSEHEIKTEVRTDSVVKSPDLSHISSSGTNEGVSPKTLAEMKQGCDSDQIPRIAILGSARIFPYLPSPPKEEALIGVTPEEWMVKSEIARRASQRAGLATKAAEVRSEKLSAVAQKTQDALVYLEAQVDPHKKMRAEKLLRIAVENEKIAKLSAEEEVAIEKAADTRKDPYATELQKSIAAKEADAAEEEATKAESSFLPQYMTQYGRTYNKRVEQEMNKFLNEMHKYGNAFITVNGGWGGSLENSAGVPLVASLFGAVGLAEQRIRGFSEALPPITIMPEAGAFDRVTTSAEVPSYFEVPGCWGDDSKYLVAFSTGLIAFEPYGYWTNIEIANGLIQNKPVAIIADPENFIMGGKYYKQMQEQSKKGLDYIEVPVTLPSGPSRSYRVYGDASKATHWIYEESMKNMLQSLQARVAEQNKILDRSSKPGERQHAWEIIRQTEIEIAKLQTKMTLPKSTSSYAVALRATRALPTEAAAHAEKMSPVDLLKELRITLGKQNKILAEAKNTGERQHAWEIIRQTEIEIAKLQTKMTLPESTSSYAVALSATRALPTEVAAHAEKMSPVDLLKELRITLGKQNKILAEAKGSVKRNHAWKDILQTERKISELEKEIAVETGRPQTKAYRP